jgi:hypothetical protein
MASWTGLEMSFSSTHLLHGALKICLAMDRDPGRHLGIEKGTVLVSYGCYNKLPQTQRLKTAQIYYLIVL